MSWFKFDDNAVDHPKIAALSHLAFRWWVKGLSYASRFLTDGVLHKLFWKQVPAPIRNELSKAKLWDWDDPNFLIHDYLHHQIGKAEIEQDKERNREKAKAFRDRRRVDRRKTDGASPVTLPVTQPGDVTDVQAGDVTDHITLDVPNPTPNPTPNTLQNLKKGEGTPATVVPIIGRHDNRNWDRRHGNHITGFCDWVCLDPQQVAEFAGKIPGDDHELKLKQIVEWARSVRVSWADRIVPDGSHFDFWRNRWTEQHGGSRPANATLKAVRVANDIDEAFR
jgi:hypothetical protein